MLEVNNINVFYGKFQALRSVSLTVKKGESVALIGPNGAGKTTTLKTISGLLKPVDGSITFNNTRIDKLSPHQIAKLGIGLVPEGRQLFEKLTVYENLLMGAYLKSGSEIRDTLEFVFQLFPRLKERRNQLAGTLSGGEQQMLAVARALMLKPSLLMIDEMSLGLMPKLVSQLFKVVERIKDEGVSILIVEQHVESALKMSDRGYLMEQGRIVLEGTGDEMLKSEYIRKVYLGI
ncbi:MAG: ABC transporter ATP-binding protein [Candidatus Methanomethylicia archaeon]